MNETAKSIDSTAQPRRPSEYQPLSRFFSTLQEIAMTTSLSFRGVVASAIFGALTCGAATVCNATEMDPPQTTVKFADLNVSNPQGAATLYARIQRAARQVCASFDGRDLRSKARMDACVHQAIADAVASVGQPALFDAFNAHNGQATRIVLAAAR